MVSTAQQGGRGAGAYGSPPSTPGGPSTRGSTPGAIPNAPVAASAGPRLDATPPSPWRVWLQAARPRTLPAAAAPVVVGTALAWTDGVLRPAAALAALVGALLIQIGTNLHNDVADFETGADNAGRLGPARATHQGWVTSRQMIVATVLSFAGAAVAGVYLTLVAGWPVIAVGIASVFSGIAYTGAGVRLGYRGLGDLFVFLFFGLVAVCGTYYVQALTLQTHVVIAAAALGWPATAILVVNNLRDRRSDGPAGKHTLVVRFGASFGRWEYTALIAAAYLTVGVAWLAGQVGAGWLLPLISLPLAAYEVRDLWRRDGAALNPKLGSTARLLLVFSVLLAVGVAV